MKRKIEQSNNEQRPNKSRKTSESSNQQLDVKCQSPGEEKEEFVLTKEIADGEILTDIAGSFWRIGKPVGKGSFGEIFLAAEDISHPVENKSAHFVAKIEPHSNGPLFVEIHCLLNVKNMKRDEDEELPLGIPEYIASGSHYFKDNRYRFLVLPRFKIDLHSIMKMGQLSPNHLLIVATKTIDVLMHLHKRNYVHSDIKAENLMIGRYKNPTSRKNLLQLVGDEDQDVDEKAHKKTDTNLAKNNNKMKINSTPFSGSNPVRSCRMAAKQKNQNTFYEEMLRSHYLRQVPAIDYSSYLAGEDSTDSHKFFSKMKEYSEAIDNSSLSAPSDNDSDFEVSMKNKKKTKKLKKSPRKKMFEKKMIAQKRRSDEAGCSKEVSGDDEEEEEEDHVYLIDYGLASKFIDSNGEHRPFCMDQRRAHDGTLEFTSRDAHFGTHARRSDLECFGYNLIYWSQGYLPWKTDKMMQQPPELIHRLKEIFMRDVKNMLKLFYGKDVPKFLGDYMEYVGQLQYDEEPDYEYLKKLFEQEFVRLGYQKSEMKLKLSEIKRECKPKNTEVSETDLLVANIADLKLVKQMGFLCGQDGDNASAMPQLNQNFHLHSSSKMSPKNLRSKVVKGGRQSKKTSPKANKQDAEERKTRNGRKLSMIDLICLDPDHIARERAEKEYERFDDKLNDQTPIRYKGRPTYAILEIESRMKSKQSNSTQNSNDGMDKEMIKGYTKPMMDVLRKRQLFIEEQIKQDRLGEEGSLLTPMKRNREGLRNVLKQTRKSIIYHDDINKKSQKKKRGRKKKVVTSVENTAAGEVGESSVVITEVVKVPKKRGRKPKVRVSEVEKTSSNGTEVPETSNTTNSSTKVNLVKRGRKPKVVVIIPEVEKATCVSSELDGESSNATTSSKVSSVKPVVVTTRRRPRKSATPKKYPNTRNQNKSRSTSRSALPMEVEVEEENDNAVDGFNELDEEVAPAQEHVDVDEESVNNSNNDDEEFEVDQEEHEDDEEEDEEEVESTPESEVENEDSDDEEVDNASDASHFNSSDQFSEIYENGEEDEEEEEEGEESAQEDTDESDDDSIDIKYSPIKTRHARRKVVYNTTINQKLRGRRKLFNLSAYTDNNRNFRTISTRG